MTNLQLNTLNGRLATFKKHGWPHAKSKSYLATPDSLATAGFYHRPFPGSEDNVACFLCHKNLDGWEENDDAWDEHVRHAANCPLVRLDTEHGRQLTFFIGGGGGDQVKRVGNDGKLCTWPHYRTLKAERMARAGFFFWPKLQARDSQTIDDTAVCFQCGLALDGWETEDDPHHEHARRRPECPFILKGVALHPCSYEFMLASKPDTTAVTHISAAATNSTILQIRPEVTSSETIAPFVPQTKSFRLPNKRPPTIAKRGHRQNAMNISTPIPTKPAIEETSYDKENVSGENIVLFSNKNEKVSNITENPAKRQKPHVVSPPITIIPPPIEILNSLGLQTMEEAETLTVDEYIELLLRRRLEEFDGKTATLLTNFDK